MINLLISGGIIMIPLFVCSIIALAIIVERFLLIKKFRREFQYNAQNLWRYINSNNAQELINTPATTSGWLFVIVKRALSMRRKGNIYMKEILQKEGENQMMNLQKRFGILSTITTIAPMLGLLGTVFGMISAFQSMQLATSLGRAVSIGDLAGGIWQSLITTAFGLIIAIPSLIFYNHFVSVVALLTSEYEKLTTSLLNMFENISTIKNDTAKNNIKPRNLEIHKYQEQVRVKMQN